MELTYKDLHFNVSLIDYPEYTGHMMFTLPTNLFLDYYEYHDREIPYLDIDSDVGDFNPLHDDEVYMYNIDAFILFLNWYRNVYVGEKQFIDVEVNHICWLVHDVDHSIYDVSGTEVYVNAQIEKDRIIDSLDWCIEQGYDLPSTTELEQIESDYNNRWERNGAKIYLEEYKYFEYEY